jgi:hypothetical protein
LNTKDANAAHLSVSRMAPLTLGHSGRI